MDTPQKPPADAESPAPEQTARRPYLPPAVVYETQLEVQAGSPIRSEDPNRWSDPFSGS